MAPTADPSLSPAEAHAALREALAHAPARRRGRLEADDFGDALYVVRIATITQLEADAMNDRLQAFVQREVQPVVAGASAGVSFLYARPEDAGDGDLDYQDVWHDVDAFFRLELHSRAVTRADVREWARFVDRFHGVVGDSGRPDGWRDVDEGSAE